MSNGSSGGWRGCGGMPEPATGEVREQTFWCRVYRCPNHVPRRSVGIPLGWMRLALGLPAGKAHYITFCSAACLQATLLWRPQEFAYDPRIDRRRVEQARQQKERRGNRRPRMEVGQENSRAVPPILSDASPSGALSALPAVEPEPPLPVVEAPAASVRYEVAGDGQLRSRPVRGSGVSREVCP